MTFDGVSADDTDNFRIRLGDVGGVETSGYISTSSFFDGSAGSGNDEVIASDSTGEFLVRRTNAGEIFHGTMDFVLSNASNNTWVSTHAGKMGGADTVTGGGTKASLDTVLTTIELTDSGGDNFDAGEVNVRWYGY